MLLQEYADYSNPYSKIKRSVKRNELTPIIKGLYETSKDTPGQYLAGSICGPSYLSFEYALAYYNLIPEGIYTFTSASFNKRKRKEYSTPFGYFTYQDIPNEAFSFGVKIINENGYSYHIATKEKALCDKLYTLPPLRNRSNLKHLLFEDLRIDIEELKKFNKEDIEFLSEKYKSTNVRLLTKYLKRI